VKATSVQDVLVEIIAAALPDVAVGLGRPDVITTGEAIWVSDQMEARYEPLTTGLASQMRSEVLTLRVVAVVAEAVGEFTARRDRAYELAREIEVAIAADQTLGGDVELAWVSQVRSEDTATPKGHITSIELEITAQSTLPTPA
jgi:hypothetical protein